jgi:hypothetical protein
VGLAADHRAGRRRLRAPGLVRGLGGASQRADPALAPVPQSHLHRRERHHLPGWAGAVRGSRLPARVSPGRPGRLGHLLRPPADPADPGNRHRLGRLRPTRQPFRPLQGLPDHPYPGHHQHGRPVMVDAGGRARHRLHHADRRARRAELGRLPGPRYRHLGDRVLPPAGGSLGTALFGAILLNRLQHNLAVLVPSGTGGRAPVDLGSLQGAPQQLRALPGPVLQPRWRRSPAPTRPSTAGRSHSRSPRCCSPVEHAERGRPWRPAPS